MAKKNVFIVGLDAFNKKKLEKLPQANECDFHAALDISDIRNVDHYDMKHLIDKARHTMENFKGSVDGVACYYDFPATDIVPILAAHFNLPGASLESVMKCENKYWSRIEQRKVIPDHLPMFQAFDPFDDGAFQKIELLPPYWIKPVKSFRSFLAFGINGERQFKEAMESVRAQINFIGAPFKYLMEQFEMPPEIAQWSEGMIAETPLNGFQCTLEGYVFNDRVTGYGIVDSIREADRSSFARYEYPSSLPLEIQHRMIDVAREAIRQIGLNNSAFNVEFFYNQTNDEVYLLEINPRISQAHTDLFEKVHGVSHHSIMIDLALGRKPRTMEKKGDFNLAGHFMLRTFEDGRVRKVPSEAEKGQLAAEIPGTFVKVPVKQDQFLHELQGQDSYSYEIANVYIGGRDQTDILEKYDRCLKKLTFEIETNRQAQIY